MKSKWIILAILICMATVLWYALQKPEVPTIRPEALHGVNAKTIIHVAATSYEDIIRPYRLKDGGVLLYGTSRTDIGGKHMGHGDAVVFKLNSSGNIVWSKHFGTTECDQIYYAMQYPDGGVLLTGDLNTTTSGESPAEMFFRARLSSNGRLMWIKKTSAKQADHGDIIECNEDGSLVYARGIVFWDNQGNVKWRFDPKKTNKSIGSYIGRHGRHYRFSAYDDTNQYRGTQTICIEDGKLASDVRNIGDYTINLGSSVPDTSLVIAMSSYSAEQRSAYLLNIDTGQRKILQTYPHENFAYEFTFQVIDHSVNGFTYLVRRDGADSGETSDDPNDNTDDRTAAVYQYSGGKNRKLFDIYVAPVWPVYITPDIIRRSDGSFVSVTCFGEYGGYGTQRDLGTVIAVFSSAGDKLGEFSTLHTARMVAVNQSTSFIAGQNENDGNVFAAALPTVTPPQFQPAAGKYTSGQRINLSCTTKDATIYYTLDGSEPTQKSTRYVGSPVSVDNNLTVKARAFRRGTIPSLRSDAVYRIGPVDK